MKKLFLLAILCGSMNLYAQQLSLKSGSYLISAEKDIRTNYNSNNKEYVIVSFSATPTVEKKAALVNAGMELFGYLPTRSFYAKLAIGIDFSNQAFSDVTNVFKIKNKFKLSKNLSAGIYPAHAIAENDQVDLIATYFKGENESNLFSGGPSVLILKRNTSLEQITIRVKLAELEGLYANSKVYYFEEIAEIGQPEDKGGRTSHRSNFLNSGSSSDLNYDGTGVTIMMQDDGFIGDHIDYKGRTDQSNCDGCSTADSDLHGDHVSGIIMGAGNLDPEGRGMASGAKLFVYNSTNESYDDVPALYDNDSMVVTSKSYSDGCNGGYSSLARQLDKQIRERPFLTHVFSAGNSGTEDCGYGAGPGWGNITGGHKSGKNVIAVGSLTRLDGLSGFSSRGPSEDGRIKPDICAVGSSVYSTISDNDYASLSGTSMSCPGVAGTLAQLYEAYRDLYGENPLSGLMKACVLNTGEDLGNPGPDFTYGWGRINARRAYTILLNNQFIHDSITQGATNVHTINIPVGTKEVKIMVYWMDYEGSTSASLAIVNDMNMIVTDPSTANFEPWLLDPTPNATALNSTAIRGVDSINNMEQVTIQDPMSGTYNVSIDGFNIPQGPQDYHLVYYFVQDEIIITYPNGGEPFEPSTLELLRWDSQDSPDNYTVELSEDNGASWVTIASLAANTKHYNWGVPATLTGEAKIRVSRGAVSDESDAVFSIIDRVENMNFVWSCPDSTRLEWDSVPGATSYQVRLLGNKYMDSIGVSATNSFVIQQPSTNFGWYTVQALGPNNAVSERQIAIEKVTGEFGCLWSDPFADFSIDCEDAGTGYCINLTELSINTDASSEFTWYFPTGTPSISTDQNPQICFDTAGDHDVAMVVDNGAGLDSIYVVDGIHINQTSTFPYFESFENYSNFVNLDQWSIDNPDNNGTWYITAAAALSGSKSARILNYVQAGNFTDDLISGPIDLSSLDASGSLTLSFRYSYRKITTLDDEWLRVSLRGNCADSWTLRKTIHGSFLSDQTAPTGGWVPSTDADWTTVHLTNVTSQFFTSDFRMKFSFESDSGNSIYLDDINIYAGAPSDEIVGLDESTLDDIVVYPNPAHNELNLRYSVGTNQKTAVTLSSLSGQLIQQHVLNSHPGNNLVVLETSNLTPGIYLLTIGKDSSTHTERVIIR